MAHHSHAPNARVDQYIKHVNDDVDDDEGGGHGDGHALHDVYVVTGDALEDQLAHTLDVEDHFDNHGSTHGVADAQAQHGERGD